MFRLPTTADMEQLSRGLVLRSEFLTFRPVGRERFFWSTRAADVANPSRIVVG